MWYEEDKDVAGCPANPRRFHYYYCVFGQQSFSAGRHYWEVEVGRKTSWRLGVARDDVPRGEMAHSGTLSGIWTLALKSGTLVACTDPEPTGIVLSSHLLRIGVFLDCEQRELSFYNAGSMAPLYTFSLGTVAAPLVPFFNPCDSDDGRNTAPLAIFISGTFPAHRHMSLFMNPSIKHAGFHLDLIAFLSEILRVICRVH